jgi:hypothetical protein
MLKVRVFGIGVIFIGVAFEDVINVFSGESLISNIELYLPTLNFEMWFIGTTPISEFSSKS